MEEDKCFLNLSVEEEDELLSIKILLIEEKYKLLYIDKEDELPDVRRSWRGGQLGKNIRVGVTGEQM